MGAGGFGHARLGGEEAFGVGGRTRLRGRLAREDAQNGRLSMILPRGSDQLLLPVNPFFIALTLAIALGVNMLPLGRQSGMPDLLAVAVVGMEIFTQRPVGDSMVLTIWGSTSSWTLTALPLFADLTSETVRLLARQVSEVRFTLGVQLIESATDPLAISAALARVAEAAGHRRGPPPPAAPRPWRPPSG